MSGKKSDNGLAGPAVAIPTRTVPLTSRTPVDDEPTPAEATPDPAETARPATADPATEQEGPSPPPSGEQRVSSEDRGGWRSRLDQLSDLSRGKLIAAATIVVVLGAFLGYLGASLWPKQYASRADVLFAITKEQPTEFLREDRTLTTQVVLMKSRTVLGPVAAANGLPIDELTENVTARIVPGSEVLEVEVRDRSPERGLALTQQILASYTTVADVQPANPARDYLEAELAAVRNRLTTARSAAATSAAGREVPSLAERERSLTTQLDSIAVDRLTTPRPQTVVPPYTVGTPVGPSAFVGAAAGALVSLMLAAGAVLVVQARRRTRADDR